MVYLGSPTQVELHILQDGLPDDYRFDQYFPSMMEKTFPLSRSAYPNLRKGAYKDGVLMGAQEMLEAVTDEFSWTAHDLFVRGRNGDGAYVCLDLEQDAIDPTEAPLDPSINVDSINWVTSLLQVKLKISLMLTPTIWKTPPI